MSANPHAIQFGGCLARILQKIWEADLREGPVLLSKWDVSDAFHRCPLRPEHVGTFAYVVPPLASNPAVYICIDLVLPMGWVSSPDLFCATSKTATDMANKSLHNPAAPYWTYRPTLGTYSTTPSPTASPARLQHADVYMDDIIAVTQGDQNQQTRVSELVLKAIKETYPSTPGEKKYSVSIIKALAGDGDWSQEKDILGWRINAKKGTLELSPSRLADLQDLLAIPPSQRCMDRSFPMLHM